jgi:ankyrin repeat protein
MVEAMLQAGADIEAVSEASRTPLLQVLNQPFGTVEADRSTLQYLEILVRYGVDVNAHPVGARSAVSLAAGSQRPLVLARLLELGAKVDTSIEVREIHDPRFARTSVRISLLSYVSIFETEIFNMLLHRGALVDCDSYDIPKFTKLEDVCSVSESRCVQTAFLLLEAGADVNATGPFGATALHRAVACRSVEHVTLLLAFGAERVISCQYGTPLHSLCFSVRNTTSFLGHDTTTQIIMDVLLEDDGPLCIDMRDENGSTPLHILAASGKMDYWDYRGSGYSYIVDPMKSLLDSSNSTDFALLTELDNHGRTVFHVAAQQGDVDLLNFLLGRVESSKESALSPDDDPEIVLITIKDKEGWTALHHAAAKGHVGACELLYKRGLAHNCLAEGTEKAVFELALINDHHYLSSDILTWAKASGRASDLDDNMGDTKTQGIRLNAFSLIYCTAVAVLVVSWYIRN